MVTQYTKAPAPATAYTKSGGQIGGVGNLCAGVESDPAIIVPTAPLTWAEVYSVAMSSSERFADGLRYGDKVVWWRESGATDKALLVHSTDGTTWVTTADIGAEVVVNTAGFYPKLQVVSGVLHLITGGGAGGLVLAVYSTSDLVAFVKKYNQTFGNGSNSALALLGSTLFALGKGNNASDENIRLWKDTGAAFTERANAGAGVANNNMGVTDAFGVIHLAEGTALKRFNDTSNTWSTVLTASGTISAMRYWPERNEFYYSVGTSVFRWLGSGAASQVFVGMVTSIDQIMVIGRNLYLCGAGSYNGITGPHLFRSPDGISIVYLGGVSLPNIAGSTGRVVYHPDTTRFYMAGYDSVASLQKIYQSSVPV